MSDGKGAPPPLPPDPRPRIPGWAGDLLAAAIVLVLTWVPYPGGAATSQDLWGWLLVAAGAALMLVRRRWPVPVIAASVVLYGLSCFHGMLSPGLAAAVAIAMFAVANTVLRRTALVINTVVIIAVVLLTVLAGWSVVDPRVVQFVLAIALGGALGEAALSGRAYVEAVTERAVRAEATRETEARRRVSEERLRIARDLHDTVAHQIAVISLHAGVATSAVDSRPDKAKESLATIRSASRAVLTEISDLLAVLRDSDDADHGVVVASPGLARLGDLLREFRRAGLEVLLRTDGDLSQVDGAADTIAYRIVQEALTNAHKHGAEHRAQVLIGVADDELWITITNPIGQPPDREQPTGFHVGLVGLRERVASVRGTIETGPYEQEWRVAARLPLSRQDTGR